MSLGQFHSSSFDPTTTTEPLAGALPAQSAQKVTDPPVYLVHETVDRIQVQCVNEATFEIPSAQNHVVNVYIGPDAVSPQNKTLAAYIAYIGSMYASMGKVVVWSPVWTFTDLSQGGVPRGYFSGTFRAVTGTYTLSWRDLKDGEDLYRYDRIYRVEGTKVQTRYSNPGEDLAGKTTTLVREPTQRYLYPGESVGGRPVESFTYYSPQQAELPYELPLTFQDSIWKTAKFTSANNYTDDRIAYYHISDYLQFVTSSGCYLTGDGATYGIAGELPDGRVALALVTLARDGRRLGVSMEPIVLQDIPRGRVLKMVPVGTDRCAILLDMYVEDKFQYLVVFIKGLVVQSRTVLELTAGPEAERTAADLTNLPGGRVSAVIRDRITGFAKRFSILAPT